MLKVNNPLPFDFKINEHSIKNKGNDNFNNNKKDKQTILSIINRYNFYH